jgi:hypothetical protein
VAWSVILELDGRPAELIADYAQFSKARAAAEDLARLHRFTGGRVSVTSSESTDQLVRYGRGKAIRQQPELPAEGQDVTVLVPRITLTSKEMREWRM